MAFAEWWVRKDASHGGANTGASYNDAWQGWSQVKWTAANNGVKPGDWLWFCGPHTYSANVALSINPLATSSSPIVIRGDWPGDPGTITLTSSAFVYMTRPWITLQKLGISNSGFTTPYLVRLDTAADGIRLKSCKLIGGKNGVSLNGIVVLTAFEVSDSEIYGQTPNDGVNGFGISYTFAPSVASTATSGILIARTKIHDVDREGVYIKLQTGLTGTPRINDVKIKNNEIYNAKRSCILFDGTCSNEDASGKPTGVPTYYSYGLEVISNEARNCGIIAGPNGTHGGIGISGAAVPLIFDNDVHDCYVTGAGIQTAQNLNPLILFNRVSGIRSGTPSSAFQNGLPIDGNGIFFDNYTVGGLAYGNKIWNLVTTGNPGSGAGLACWQNAGSKFIGNIVEGAGCGVVYGNIVESGNMIYNNTFINCGVGIEKVGTGALASPMKAFNNIFVNCPTVFKAGTNPSIIVDYNCMYGHTTAYSGVTPGANDIVADPQLDANYRPQNAAVIRKGTPLGGKDFRGKDFSSTPNMGALEDHRDPAWVSVTEAI